MSLNASFFWRLRYIPCSCALFMRQVGAMQVLVCYPPLQTGQPLGARIGSAGFNIGT